MNYINENKIIQAMKCNNYSKCYIIKNNFHRVCLFASNKGYIIGISLPSENNPYFDFGELEQTNDNNISLMCSSRLHISSNKFEKSLKRIINNIEKSIIIEQNINLYDKNMKRKIIFSNINKAISLYAKCNNYTDIIQKY